ncbi:MAG: hypothetical protein U0411_12280 [Thermodesulfovibrionales bacterium]
MRIVRFCVLGNILRKVGLLRLMQRSTDKETVQYLERSFGIPYEEIMMIAIEITFWMSLTAASSLELLEKL